MGKNQIDVRMISNTVIDSDLYDSAVIPVDIDSVASYIPVKQKTSSTIAANTNQNFILLALKLQLENEAGNYLLLEEKDASYKLKLMSKNNKQLSTVDIPKPKEKPNELPDYSAIRDKYLYVTPDGHLIWSTVPGGGGDPGDIKILYNTTAGWDSQPDLRAAKGTIYIYTDKYSYTTDIGRTQIVPGIKIGNGTAYLIDLAFITDYNGRRITKHIEDTAVHIQSGEREKWNNKLNYIDPLDSDLLIFTRN